MGPVGRAFQRSCRQPGFLLIPLLFCLPTHPPPPLPFIFFLFYLFWLHWVFVAARGLLSSCSEQELLSACGPQASHCGSLSCCGRRALSGPVVVARRFSCSAARGIFPNQTELMSPAAAGRFFTTETPGKPTLTVFNYTFQCR